jgi:hypothetical protein
MSDSSSSKLLTSSDPVEDIEMQPQDVEQAPDNQKSPYVRIANMTELSVAMISSLTYLECMGLKNRSLLAKLHLVG